MIAGAGRTPSSAHAIWFCPQSLGDNMPEISRFFGIIIRMYFDDHAPPHFHAYYAGQQAEVGIQPIGLLKGTLPRRAISLVVEWAGMHQDELMENWRRLHVRGAGGPIQIAPLE